MVFIRAEPLEPKLTLTLSIGEVKIITGIFAAVQGKSRLNDAPWNKPV
jgi:hypothetical protein